VFTRSFACMCENALLAGDRARLHAITVVVSDVIRK
jgi:hypothetical protein